MYIDEFYFSPFKIADNVVTVWSGTVTIKHGIIYLRHDEISCDAFYDMFAERSRDTWFVKDFIDAFDTRRGALPDGIAEFAIYCQFKSQFYPHQLK